MRNKHAIDEIVPKTRQGILAATLVQPERTWYASELARRMGVPSSSLQRELQGLTSAGVLRAQRRGRMVFYQANRESPLFPELRGLMLKTAGLVDVLADALQPLAKKLRLVFVHGSLAAGGERNDSDVDLIVIGDVSSVDLAARLRKAREALDRPINPTVYTPAEFAQKRADRDHFLTRVLDKPKLFVVGKENDLVHVEG
jgi:predicted nucleotidyltransferase